MAVLLVTTVAANIVIFTVLGMLAWSAARREESLPLRRMAAAVSLVCWAFVLGATTRLVLLAVRQEWLAGRVQDFVVGEWHLAQSLAATGLGVAVALTVRRLGPDLRRADRVLRHLEPDQTLHPSLDLLTPREREVLAVMTPGHTSDRHIAQILFISPATAAGHVKSIRRKLGARSRRHLLLLAPSVRLQPEHRSPDGIQR